MSALLLLLIVSMAIALNIRKKAIERLSKEVAECERMVKKAFDLAQLTELPMLARIKITKKNSLS